ncbi:carbohydrate deacetylase [Desulfolucanica intricata]|uniref:carbohydrate deacetylase n=1 Tax=Desulfolucanica intricata TaxID=1285191 RepID=UPI000834E8C2|nr:carbohydrate deacetylase [Desulfolucanica intricata]
MRLIVNADDFGYSRGVNEGIIIAFQQGIVTSTSLMVNEEGSEHAFDLLKNKCIPGTGVHLCITHGRPVSPVETIPSLVDRAGSFKKINAFYGEPVNLEEVIREFEAQVQKAVSRGINVTHLDTHHHIHLHPVVLQAVIAVALEYGLPVRSVNEEMKNTFLVRGISTPDYFCAEWFGDAVSFANFKEIISTAQNKSIALMELMTHPGKVDQTLSRNSSYKEGREKELEILCDSSTREFLKERNIELIGRSASLDK